MKSSIALVIYYTSQNRNSFNALLGALEQDKYFDDLDVYFAGDEKGLEEKISNVSPRYKKAIVCLSFCTPEVGDIAHLIKRLRKKFGSHVLFIAGGPHPSGDPRGTLNLGFDIVYVGEGEETFPQILKKINEDKDFKKLKGLAFIRQGKFIFTGTRGNIDLDHYRPFSVKYRKFGPVEITRGCPWGCKFCQTSYLFGRKPRHRSISTIYKYVEIYKSYGFKDVRFITPNAFSYGSKNGETINLRAIERLLSSVKGIVGAQGRIFYGSFPSEVRPDLVTEEVIELVKKYSNNDNLIIGAQSGSERMLKMIGRGHGVEDIYKSVKLVVKAGFKVNVDFIFGLPGETEKDTKLTLKVMENLIKMGARIHGHTFIPLAGTPYAGKPGGKLSTETKRVLMKLASQGKLYGDWQKQEKIVQKIFNLAG